jgi:uncharacterized membrane protein YbhN (UPF0104 family)
VRLLDWNASGVSARREQGQMHLLRLALRHSSWPDCYSKEIHLPVAESRLMWFPVWVFVGKYFRWVEGVSSTFPRLLWAYGLSIVFYVIFGFAHYLVGLSLGLRVSFPYVIFFVTVISLVSMIPVTISGIGLREGGYALCLKAAGVPLNNATAFSLLWLLVLLLGALVGGIVYLMGMGRTENGRF